MSALLALLWLHTASASSNMPLPSPIEAAPAEQLEPPSVLDSSAYRFCHEPGLWGAQSKQWCPLLDGLPPERCPGLRATCGGAPDVQPWSLWDWFTGDEPDTELGAAPAPPPKPPSTPWSCEPPSLDFTTGLQWVIAGLVAIFIAMFAALVLRMVLKRRLPEPPPVPARAREAAPPPPNVAEALEDTPDLPSLDLLAAAKAALAAGKPGEAVWLARGAALRQLGERGRLRLHRARTDREYVRELREDAELSGALRTLAGSAERHKWGAQPVLSAEAQDALDAAGRILTLACLLLFANVSHAAPFARHGPDGDIAIRDTLVASGHDANWRLRHLAQLGEDTECLLLEMDAVVPDTSTRNRVRRWVEQGHLLILVGTHDSDYPELGEYVQLYGNHADAAWAPPYDQALGPPPRLPDGETGAYRLGPAASAIAVVRGDNGEQLASIATARVGQGRVLAIASATSTYNGAYVVPSNEYWLGDLLSVGVAAHGWPGELPLEIALATSISVKGPPGSSKDAPGEGGESEAPSPMSSLSQARLLPFIMQLMLCWAIFAWSRGWPFGPPKPSDPALRRSFVAHAHALAARWRQLGAADHARRAYARYLLARGGPTAILARARRNGASDTEARAVLEALQHAAASTGLPPRAALTQLEDLWKANHSPRSR